MKANMTTFSRIILLLLCISNSSSILAQTISIATYNIRYPNPGDGPDFWPHRAAAVADFLKDFDVVGLQEAKFTQLGDLVQPLSDYERYGVGRDDGKQSGETVSIYFRKSRFDLKDKGTIWLSDTPNKVGSKGWDAALPRILSWVLLVDKNSNQRLLVANTHFDHRGKQARAESGKLIQAFLSKKTDQDLPIVLLGDFNCRKDSAPYNAIIKADDDFKLLDARSAAQSAPVGPNSTWCGFKKIVPEQIIDHIFVNEIVSVQTFETHNPKTKAGRFASDHLPVSVTVAW